MNNIVNMKSYRRPIKLSKSRAINQASEVFRNLQSVIWEYITNGLAYTEKGTSPEVIVSMGKDKITFADNGRGMDIKDFLVDSSNQKKGFETFKDTLMEIIALDTSSESFSTGLMGEFYVGGNLRITKNHNVGALMYGSFYRKEFYPALTLSWNSQIGNILALSASYTIYRESYVNLGFGVALNLGPEQFYITTDNAIGSATDNTRNLGVHFGWNHIFGKKKDKKIACEI